MAYFTRTLERQWGRNEYVSTGHQLMVAHNDCLPEDQFELIGPEGHQIRHQKDPWCWAPVYGGALAYREGRCEYDSPRHLCHFCGEPVE